MLLRTYPLITHPAFLRHVENTLGGEELFAGEAPADVPVHCPRIKSPYQLAQYLGVNPLLVRSFVATKDKHYREFQIRKRSGGVRTIHAPRTFLKVAQWWILDAVFGCREELPYVFGFTAGRSFIDNAREHQIADYILNVDIKDFFPSANRSQVYQVFSSLGYNPGVADFLTEICTREGSLPQGAPTSPKLSNIILHDFDIWAKQVSDQLGCKYTRYADDLTFSSMNRIPQYLVGEIDSALSRAGFRLNENKTKFMGKNQVKEVTGLILTPTGVALPRRYLNGTRGWFHSILEAPDRFQHERKRVAGTLNLLRQIGGRGTGRLIMAGELALSVLAEGAPPKLKW